MIKILEIIFNDFIFWFLWLPPIFSISIINDDVKCIVC